jgi:ASC-1-like (ASCH) protein
MKLNVLQRLKVNKDMVHSLKIEDKYLERLVSGEKKAEIRYNDRDYQVGDILIFQGNEKFRITHIHSGLYMEDGYVVLSLERLT